MRYVVDFVSHSVLSYYPFRINIPLGIIDVVTFGAIVYWISGTQGDIHVALLRNAYASSSLPIGLYPSAWRFLYFCLILFFLRQTMNGAYACALYFHLSTPLTRTAIVFALLLSATVPAPIVASLVASALSIIFIIFSGMHPIDHCIYIYRECLLWLIGQQSPSRLSHHSHAPTILLEVWSLHLSHSLRL